MRKQATKGMKALQRLKILRMAKNNPEIEKFLLNKMKEQEKEKI